MNLHPDILTDLVILYHAGEASEASRALLETEAQGNPKLAAALAAPPRGVPHLPVGAPDVHRRAIHDIRSVFRFRLLFTGFSVALLALAIFQPGAGTGRPWLPLVYLFIAMGVAFLALRAHRHGHRRL